MVFDGPVHKVLDFDPISSGSWGATESFAPEDLPRNTLYRCLWNPTTSEYDCQLFTPDAEDEAVEINPLTISDRYDGDTEYRSVQYDFATNAFGGGSNLCKGKRWYAGQGQQRLESWGGETFVTPDECKYQEDGAPTLLSCNWGVLPGHIGDMSTGPWLNTFAAKLKWFVVTVSGVKKVRIVVTGGDFGGWWGETNFYRAGSTPTAPIFWWPIPTGEEIRLAWTPTITDDNSEPIDDPGASAEAFTFTPWPDLILSSCSNDLPPPPPDCEVEDACKPCPCLLSPDGSTTYDIEFSLTIREDDLFELIEGTLTWNGSSWQTALSGMGAITLICVGGTGLGGWMLVVVIDGVSHSFAVNLECDGNNIVDVSVSDVSGGFGVSVILTTDNPL
jgi:hypothetical protein